MQCTTGGAYKPTLNSKDDVWRRTLIRYTTGCAYKPKITARTTCGEVTHHSPNRAEDSLGADCTVVFSWDHALLPGYIVIRTTYGE